MNTTTRGSTGVVDAWLGERFRVTRLGVIHTTLADIASGMRQLGHTTWKPGTVSNFETGKRNVTATELADLCAVYRTPLPLLFTGPATGDVADGWVDTTSDGYVQAHSMLEVNPARAVDDTQTAIDERVRTLLRVESRVYTAVFGQPPDEHQRMALHEYAHDKYGHDLLTERERLQDEGESAQWATRRITDEIRADGLTPAKLLKRSRAAQAGRRTGNAVRQATRKGGK